MKKGRKGDRLSDVFLVICVTECQPKTSLSKHVKSGSVSVKKSLKIRVVPLFNCEKYQGMSGKKSPKSQSNDRQQVSQMSPLKEIKNNKEINNIVAVVVII